MHEAPAHELIKTVSAGILSTLTLVLVSAKLPWIGLFSSWLIPLPVLFYRTRLSRKTAALIPVVALIILASAGKGFSTDFVLYSGLMLLGFLLGESFEKFYSIDRTILISCGGVLLAGFVTLIFYSSVANSGFTGLVSGYVDQNLSMTIELYKEMGVPEENLGILSDSRDKLVFYLTRIIPGISAAMLIISAWINILIAGSIFSKHGISFADYGKLKFWKAPEQLVWIAIVSGLALMVPLEAIHLVSMNLILVLLVIYFLQGISVTAFYFDKKNFPRGLRILLYGLIMLQSILKIFVIGIGFFDLWVNFRKIGNDKNRHT